VLEEMLVWDVEKFEPYSRVVLLAVLPLKAFVRVSVGQAQVVVVY